MNSMWIKTIKQNKMRSHMRDGSRLWDYQVLEELGKGEYGQVFKVRNKKDGLFYALKRVNISSCHQKEKIQAFRQVKALKLIKHPDIIEYYESFLSMDNIYIVMEYASKGDFSKIIKERRLKEKSFSELELWDIFSTLAGAIKHLHEKGIIHRDLKLENIFMTESGKIKIGDLGMCKVMNQANELISTRVGTPMYFAPEIIQHQLYSYPVDIWALGCVFYFLATLQHPYKDATMETLSYYVIDRDPRPIKGHYGGYLINFITSLLTKNSKNRPDIFQACLEIKNHENPAITNKVKVFDFKKLIMMGQDIQKLDDFKKALNKTSMKMNKQINAEAQPVSDRYHQKSSEIKTYRDYIKLNVSASKAEHKKDATNPEQPGSPSQKKKSRVKMQGNSLSLVLPSRKVTEKTIEPFSPIKTNGFSDMRQANIKADLTILPQTLQRHTRNFTAIRQQLRKPVLS